LPVAIPFIIGAIGGGLTAYDTYDTYQTEGAGAAAKSAAVGAALTAAGAGAAKAAGSIGKRIDGFFRKDAAEGRKTSEGIGYTKHGLNQRINREVPTADVLDALRDPLKVNEVKIDSLGRPSQRTVGTGAEVVRNLETGNIVSVNKTSTKKAERLYRQRESQAQEGGAGQ